MLHLSALPQLLLFMVCMGSPSFVLFAQCKSGDCNNGVGMYVYSERTIYEGNFKDGLPNGTGRLIRGNGDEYVGTFVNGLYSGEGQLRFANGDVYTGQFKQGMRDGNGVLLKKDGTIINGPFTNNVTPGTKAAWMSVDSMGFYTGPISAQSAGHVDSAGHVWVDSIAFDPRTGQVLPDLHPDTSNRRRLTLQFEGTSYVLRTPDFADYLSSKYTHPAPEQKQGRRSKPKSLPNEALFEIAPWEILQTGPDYYIGRSLSKELLVPAPHYATQLYKISSGHIDTIAVVDLNCKPDDQFLFSDDLSLIYSVNGKVAFTQKGTRKVEVAIPAYAWDEVPTSTRYWFSNRQDTLFYLVQNKFKQRSINDRRPPFKVTLNKYLLANGTLVSSEEMGYNTRLQGIHGDYRMIGFDYKRRQAIVAFSPYMTRVDYGSLGHTDYIMSNKQAALLRLDDPDYLLPLKNPAYDLAYFDGIEKGVQVIWDQYISDRRKAQEAADKRDAKNFNPFNDEEEVDRERKPVKKSSGTAGVCIWCKGAGKVTSKDVYNKGYNSNYTGGGGGKFYLGRGNESFTTEICPICAGSGH